MTLILIAHVIGAGILIGGTVCSIFMLSTKKDIHAALGFITSFGEVMKYAALSQLITGAMLYMHEPGEFRGKTSFWIKLVLYGISGFVAGGIIQKNVKALQKESTPQTSKLYKLFLLHLVIILAIVSIGVFLVESD